MPQINSSPFLFNYLWQDRTNRRWSIAGLAAFIVQFIVFKSIFPFANYMPDSYSYLQAAATNADVNTWPVAYSKFLRLFSAFTHSDVLLVGFQYFFLQTSSLLFLFTLLHFLQPGKGVKATLIIFFLLNPLPLFIANYIAADALYIGLSLFWITTLVWTIYRPRTYMLLFHGILLLGCFVLRYNAIYYPLISLVVFLLSRLSWKQKLLGISLGTALVLVSFLYTSYAMKAATGTRQFSAFGGWQLANNALYMYEHIPADQRGPIPPRFEKLEIMVREHMDTLQKVKFTRDDSATNFFYLWNDKSPLIQYLVRKYHTDNTAPYFNRWASVSPLYGDYAFYLIKKYPVQFAENFLLPNAVKYAVPPTEFLDTYNMGSDSVAQLAKDWFNYKSLKVKENNTKDTHIALVEWYPVFSAIVNMIFLMGLIGMLFLNAIRWKEYGFPQFLTLITMLWILNAGFSIFASPIVLRYQAFPILVFFVVGTILVERIYKMATNENP